MTWYHVLYFVSVLITIAVMGFITWYSYKHKDVAGANTYMWISLLVSLLALFEGLSMVSPSKECALFWFNLRFLSFSTIPVIWLIFVLQFSGKSNLVTKPRVIAFFIIPVITQIMIWTNDLHGLWVKQSVEFYQAGPFFIAETASRIPGIWYSVHLLYTYSNMLLGLVFLFVLSVRVFTLYRGQIIALGTGTFIIILGSLFPALNLIPGMQFNPILHSFALGSIIISWGIFKYRFLAIKPLFNDEKRAPVLLIILFLILTLAIVSVGFIYYNQYEKHFRIELDNQLSSIAELKVSEIVQWRAERLGDANILYGNSVFTSLVRQYYSDPADTVSEQQIKTWLGKFHSSNKYDKILMVDINGIPRISVPNSAKYVREYFMQQAAEINSSHQITFLDFHRDSPDTPIHLTVIVPIIDGVTNRFFGFIAFIIDPESYLYPLINRWPTPSRTAETLLLRRDGNDVLFLNELKFRQNTALSLRVPLTNDIMPSVMAVKGHIGIVEGIDYRGVSVIAAVLPVPDSPWFMVARIDIAEVYAPLRSRILSIITVLFTLIAGAGASVGLIWHRQNSRLYLERLTAAELLSESERKYHSLYNNAQVGLFETSFKEAKIISCNQRYCDMAGFPSIESVLGTDVLQTYVNQSDREEVKNILYKQGYITNHVFPCKKYVTGEIFWAELNARLDRARDVSEGMIIDITKRRVAEDALIKYKDHLEEMVKARTEKLEKAEEEAVAANRAKSIFLSNMSHEMRTPLNAILGFSELMQQDKNIPENYIKWLETINRSGEHLLALINDILEVTKIEAGGIIFTKSAFNIHSLLKDIETIFRIKANAKNLNLFADYSVDLPEYIVTDENKLRQIMINFLSNAVKFTKEGIINLRARVIYENDKMYLIAEVEDTGPGIAEKDIEKLFQKFGKTETGLNEGGTGLGLAISQQYAEIMNGIITVKSEKGKGACFTLKIVIEDGKESAKKLN